jgi:hypothetical protein
MIAMSFYLAKSLKVRQSAQAQKGKKEEETVIRMEE